MGAWIETWRNPEAGAEAMSLPTWERGLKPQPYFKIIFYTWSLPTWERGLKLNLQALINHAEHVAPHVGAWIETNNALGRE